MKAETRARLEAWKEHFQGRCDFDEDHRDAFEAILEALLEEEEE